MPSARTHSQANLDEGLYETWELEGVRGSTTSNLVYVGVKVDFPNRGGDWIVQRPPLCYFDDLRLREGVCRGSVYSQTT